MPIIIYILSPSQEKPIQNPDVYIETAGNLELLDDKGIVFLIKLFSITTT